MHHYIWLLAERLEKKSDVFVGDIGLAALLNGVPDLFVVQTQGDLRRRLAGCRVVNWE
jgi:hypothetical protein